MLSLLHTCVATRFDRYWKSYIYHVVLKCGAINHFPPFRYFHDFSPLLNTGYLQNITFIFVRCRRSSPVVDISVNSKKLQVFLQNQNLFNGESSERSFGN